MPRLTPEREEKLRNGLGAGTSGWTIYFTSAEAEELFDEIEALRHEAKSFNRNFEFMKQELEECEEKNKKLTYQLEMGHKDLQKIHELLGINAKLMKVVEAARKVDKTLCFGSVREYDQACLEQETALKELDGEK